MQTFCLVSLVQGLPLLVQRLMLGMYGRGVRFEREQVPLELLEVLPMTRRAELCAMQLLEFLHEFGVL
jgi:hypothetical protein